MRGLLAEPCRQGNAFLGKFKRIRTLRDRLIEGLQTMEPQPSHAEDASACIYKENRENTILVFPTCYGVIAACAGAPLNFFEISGPWRVTSQVGTDEFFFWQSTSQHTHRACVPPKTSGQWHEGR